jgi:hypothetical protein
MKAAATTRAPNYLAPDVPAGLPWLTVPVVEATAERLQGYGHIVADPERHAIEIVRWPATGWRPVDPDSGDQGGIAEGVFEFWWKGEVLYGRNNAVGDSYVLGWSKDPAAAVETAPDADRSQALLWHANYHPDGGQLFYPLDRQPFIAPLALPGDDVRPDRFVGFYFDGTSGLYIHPGVWHEAVFPLTASARFLDKQGRVHARVSCDFAREFGTLLRVPLARP